MTKKMESVTAEGDMVLEAAKAPVKKKAKKSSKKKASRKGSKPQLEDVLLELIGRLDAIETRLDVTESRETMPAPQDPTTQDSLESRGQSELRARQVAPPQSMVGQPMEDQVLDRYEQIQQKRDRDAEKNPRVPRTKSTNAQDMKQRLRELEGQPSSSARMRLQDMKVRGTLKDFKILPPGAQLPRDFNEKRALITVDQYGLVISADLG